MKLARLVGVVVAAGALVACAEGSTTEPPVPQGSGAGSGFGGSVVSTGGSSSTQAGPGGIGGEPGSGGAAGGSGGNAGGAGGGEGGAGGIPGPTAQACPTGELVTAIDTGGAETLTCESPDAYFEAEINASCRVYFGWRDECDGCALAPTKWGRVGDASCMNGAGSDNTCLTVTLGTATLDLFGLNTDGDVDGNDKFYLGFHCGTGTSTPEAGPCDPGEFVTGYDGTTVTCTPISGVVLSYVRDNCFIYQGWRDSCDGCTTAPAKWGRANDGSCQNGAGTDNSCTTATLGGESVRLFGMNTDGEVNGDDKFYTALHCAPKTPQGGPAVDTCPAGQFMIGTNTDGTIQCITVAPLVEDYFAASCTLYYGWQDNCSGCSTAPGKWGRVRDGFCANGAGANNTCTLPTLGGDTISTFGLNTDGDVDGNDTFHMAFRCQ